FNIYQSIFGLKFEKIVAPYKWIDDLQLYLVADSATGEPLGMFYLDMFPREGKFNHFAQFDIISGKLLPNGKYQRPTVALLCNFPPASGDAPSLMTHQDVETLFHEFGHALHSIVTRAKYGRFAGTHVPGDFVEAPSQMLQNWVWDKKVLDTFAAGYRDPSKKIPAEAVKKLNDAKLANAGVLYRRQFAFASLDLALHEQHPEDASYDCVAISNPTLEKVFLPIDPSTTFVSYFGHLNGYDAGYYGYAWADAIAADMATVFEKAKDGYLDKQAGLKLRREIYEAGDSRDVAVSIEKFLGRKQSIQPFLKKIGITDKNTSMPSSSPTRLSRVTFSMSESTEESRKIQRLDPLLVAALSLAFLFCLQGITWGRVECWNRSQIALHSLRALRPGDYMKPPFHIYLNHVLVVWPITGALKIAQVPTERMKIANSAKLIGSRLVTLALYLGTIALAYSFSRRSYGRFSAAVIAFAFATSAGFVTYAHFLTADAPLLFWMLAAFWAAHRLASAPSTRNYAIAGFLIGITIATKYNGVAVGIALRVAHFFATKSASIRSIILSRQLAVALAMALLGFLFGCPTAPYEPKKFWHDFIYNYTVAPRYSGQPDRPNYLGALARIPAIVGLPGAILIAGLAILSCILILRRRDLSDAATRGFILSSAVFLLYFLKVGSWPQTETRYVLRAIPFLILMIGPALQTVEKRKWILALQQSAAPDQSLE